MNLQLATLDYVVSDPVQIVKVYLLQLTHSQNIASTQVVVNIRGAEAMSEDESMSRGSGFRIEAGNCLPVRLASDGGVAGLL